MKNTMALQKSLLVKKSKKGFTLVELVVVIAILAILAAVAIPVVTSLINKANRSADQSTASTVTSTLNTAYSEIESGIRTDITLTSSVADCLKAYNVELGSNSYSGWSWAYLDGVCYADSSECGTGSPTALDPASVNLQTFMGNAHT